MSKKGENINKTKTNDIKLDDEIAKVGALFNEKKMFPFTKQP